GIGGGQWNLDPRHALGWRRHNVEAGRHALRDDRTRADHRSFADSDQTVGAAGDDAVGTDKCFLFDDHPTGATRVRNYNRPDTDLHIVVNLDALGILVIQ